MKLIRSWWVVIAAVLAFAVQWGMLAQRVYAYDNDHQTVTEVKDRLAHIEEILIANSHDNSRIEAELVQIRQILMKSYGAHGK